MDVLRWPQKVSASASIEVIFTNENVLGKILKNPLKVLHTFYQLNDAKKYFIYKTLFIFQQASQHDKPMLVHLIQLFIFYKWMIKISTNQINY